MTRKERLELIDKYLDRQISGIELARFESLLESDELLRKDLEFVRELHEAINDQSDYSIAKKLLKEAENDYFTKDQKSGFSLLQIAATVTLLVAGSVVLWFFLRKESPEAYFADHFTPYPAPTNFRGPDLAAMDDAFMLGLIRYEEGEYVEATRLFEETLSRDSLNYTARFLLGISFMAQKDFEKAEPILKSLSEDSSHLFQVQAREYLEVLRRSEGE